MRSRVNSTVAGLKVLALHGDGLHGLGIISVIDELCSRIAVTQYARPCELFDVICGTGIGAFVAVLLGRYCLDIGKCKQIYMDLAEFVEERQSTRRMSHSRVIEEDDVRDFMELLIDEEGWSDTMEIPATAKHQACQHVFVVFHGLQAQVDAARRKSMPLSAKPNRIPRVLAASVTHSVHDWQPIANGQMTGFEARIPHVHGMVVTAVEEIMASYQSDASIEFLASIGPQRAEPSSPTNLSKEPRSPAQWVMDKASPVRSVVMWPVKVTKRTLMASDPIPDAQDDGHQSPEYRKRRPKSLSVMQWPLQSQSAPINIEEDAEREDRRELVMEQVYQLLDGASERRIFNFAFAEPHETSDMADLKDTRSNIKAIIEYMNGTGLFEEAAGCFRGTSGISEASIGRSGSG